MSPSPTPEKTAAALAQSDASRDFNSTMNRLRTFDPSAAGVLWDYQQRAIKAEDKLRLIRETLEETDDD